MSDHCSDGIEQRRENWLEAISDISHRWSISPEAAEAFLEDVGYSPPPHDPRAITDGGIDQEHRLKEGYYEWGEVLCDGCNETVDLSEADDFSEAVEIWTEHVDSVHSGGESA